MRLFFGGRLRRPGYLAGKRWILGDSGRGKIVVGWAVCLSVFMGASGTFAAATDPLCSTDPRETVNPPETANPIYYPFPVDAKMGGPEVAPEALLREFMDRHTAMDYPAAAEAALRLADAVPDRPEAFYNLACVMSKLHRPGEALAALDKAIECGWRDLQHTAMDPDLANLRNNDGYATLISKLKARILQEQIVSSPLRKDGLETIRADLEHHVPELLARYHVPGATIALVHDGEVVWTSAFGVRDRRTNETMREQDRFRVRGPLHLLAIMAAQQAQDQGQLRLAQLLEQGAQADQLAARAAQRSNGPAGSKADGPPGGRTSTVGFDQPAGDATCKGKPIMKGTDSTASSAYGLLQLAIEMASGQTFSAYCTQHILNPLRLLDSDFAAPRDENQKLATGHSRLGSPMQPNPKADELALGGSLYTTADDLGRLVQALMIKPDASGAAGASSMTSASISQSAAAALETAAQLESSMPGGLGLNLSVKHSTVGQRMQVAETASGIGCLMRWYPAARTGIVVLYNSATGRDAAERIAHLALGGEE